MLGPAAKPNVQPKTDSSHLYETVDSRKFNSIIAKAKKDKEDKELKLMLEKKKAALKKKQAEDKKKREEKAEQQQDFLSLIKESDKVDLNPLQSLVSSEAGALESNSLEMFGQEAQKKARAMTAEEMRHRMFLEEQARLEREEKERKLRYADRNNVEELIGPILSLDIVKEFYDKSLNDLNLPEVPTVFPSHTSYMQAWMPLFLFETYN